MAQRNPTIQEIDTFCKAIVEEGMIQRDAWRKTFPNAKKSSNSTADSKASEFKKLPRVAARLAEMRKQVSSDLDIEFNITANSLAADFKQMWEFDIADILDGDMQYKHPNHWPKAARRCIQDFETTTRTTQGGDEITTVKIKFVSRLKVGEMIAQYIGMFEAPESSNVNITLATQDW